MRYVISTLQVSALCACGGARPRQPASPRISWHCEFDPENSRGGPASILVDGRSFVMLRYGTSGCHILDPSEYRLHDVPDYAISAAAGWFAGGGEEFSAVVYGTTLVVYHRLVEETGPVASTLSYSRAHSVASHYV